MLTCRALLVFCKHCEDLPFYVSALSAHASQEASHARFEWRACKSPVCERVSAVWCGLCWQQLFCIRCLPCCEVVPSGFVGLLWGMVCGEGGHGWVHFLVSRTLHIDVVQFACVRVLVFSHCNLFFVLCSCFFVKFGTHCMYQFVHQIICMCSCQSQHLFPCEPSFRVVTWTTVMSLGCLLCSAILM